MRLADHYTAELRSRTAAGYDFHVKGLEIFSAGEHTDAGGYVDKWTAKDLDGMVAAFDAGKPDFVPVKLGHTSAEFNAKVAAALNVPAAVLTGEKSGGAVDGVAALGQMVSLRRVQNKVIADLALAPGLRPLIKQGMYREVSVEMHKDDSGDWVVTAVTLLGGEAPAVSDLAGLAGAAVLSQNRSDVKVFKVGELPSPSQGQGFWAKLRTLMQDPEAKRAFAEMDDKKGKPFGDDKKKPEGDGAEGEGEGAPEGEADGIDKVLFMVRFMLGLTEEAGGDEILAALRQMMGLGEATANDQQVATKMKERLTMGAEKTTPVHETPEFKAAVDKAVDERTKTLTTQVATLTSDARRHAFTQRVVKFTATGRKPEDMVTHLMTLEDKLGKDAVESQVKDWERMGDLADQAGITRRFGISGDEPKDPPKHKFRAAAEALATEKKISVERAMAQMSMSDPVGFAEYHANELEAQEA